MYLLKERLSDEQMVELMVMIEDVIGYTENAIEQAKKLKRPDLVANAVGALRFLFRAYAAAAGDPISIRDIKELVVLTQVEVDSLEVQMSRAERDYKYLREIARRERVIGHPRMRDIILEAMIAKRRNLSWAVLIMKNWVA